MAAINPSDLVGRAPGGRKLIAIVYADIVGYSRLIGLDDIGTLQALRKLRSNLIDPAIVKHGGSLVQTGGDSLLIAFDSIDGAVCCAVDFQHGAPSFDVDRPADRTIRFRIGINIGDIIADGTDLHGDGVNIAARLQAECPPGGICVSRAVRDHTHVRLDLIFDELGALSLKNIARPVEAFLVRLEPQAAELNSPQRQSTIGTPASRPETPESRTHSPDKLSIVVLPFQNLSGDAGQDYFVDGMVDEITTALSRTRWFYVIARNSAFTYKGRSVDVRQVGLALGVRYVLEGSVRRAGSRVRMTGQLIDAETGHHVWADRFDGSLDNVIDLQDRIAACVVGAVGPQILSAEFERAQRMPPGDLQSYDLWLRALAHFYAHGCVDLARAADFARKAIEKSPGYAKGHSLLALCLWGQVSQGCLQDNGAATREALCRARKALSLQPKDPEVLTVAGWLMAIVAGDYRRGLALCERSLSLNPNNPGALGTAATLHAYAGDTDAVLEYVERAIRLDPFGGGGPYSNLAVSIVHFANGRYGDVVEATATVLRERPDMAPALRYRAASLGLLGRIKEGQAVVRQLIVIVPDFTITRARSHLENDMNRPFTNPGAIDALCEGLSRLGVPA
jgi:adenylate cyclase